MYCEDYKRTTINNAIYDLNLNVIKKRQLGHLAGLLMLTISDFQEELHMSLTANKRR